MVSGRRPKIPKEELDAAIRDLYPEGGPKAVQDRYPQYSRVTIKDRAQKLGIRAKHRFTAEQEDAIRLRYHQEGAATLATEIGCSTDSVWAKAQHLGLTRPRRSKVLTEQSVAEIKHRLLNGERVVDLAQDYDVARATISAIKAGKTWSQVDPSNGGEHGA